MTGRINPNTIRAHLRAHRCRAELNVALCSCGYRFHGSNWYAGWIEHFMTTLQGRTGVLSA